jgi:site-specific DNA-adenine methylase
VQISGESEIQMPDFAAMEGFKYENDRHRVIVAMLIADSFLFFMKHLKSNHVIQFIYVSQLVVDANGVLVLLKFLNQDFAKVVDFSVEKNEESVDFIYTSPDCLPLAKVMDHSISSLLQLMYTTCKHQSQRIKDYLVQYKAALIMKRLITRFDCPIVRTLAAKIIKIQIRYMNRTWRKNNMKIVSLVYQYVRIRRLDDWLGNSEAGFEDENTLT